MSSHTFTCLEQLKSCSLSTCKTKQGGVQLEHAGKLTAAPEQDLERRSRSEAVWMFRQGAVSIGFRMCNRWYYKDMLFYDSLWNVVGIHITRPRTCWTCNCSTIGANLFGYNSGLECWHSRREMAS
jgi:hypothetical protein